MYGAFNCRYARALLRLAPVLKILLENGNE